MGSLALIDLIATQPSKERRFDVKIARLIVTLARTWLFRVRSPAFRRFLECVNAKSAVLPTSRKRAHQCDFRVGSPAFRRPELFSAFCRLKAELQTRMGSRTLIDLIATQPSKERRLDVKIARLIVMLARTWLFRVGSPAFRRFF